MWNFLPSNPEPDWDNLKIFKIKLKHCCYKYLTSNRQSSFAVGCCLVHITHLSLCKNKQNLKKLINWYLMYKILQPVLDVLYIPVNMSQCWHVCGIIWSHPFIYITIPACKHRSLEVHMRWRCWNEILACRTHYRMSVNFSIESKSLMKSNSGWLQPADLCGVKGII